MLTPDGEYFEKHELKNQTSSNLQAKSDDHLIEMWLFGKSANSQQSYAFDIAEFRNLFQKPLQEMILSDLQYYATWLEEKGLKPRSRQRKLAALKSLFSFAADLRYIPFDLGKPIKLPRAKDDLANRILDESTIIKIIYTERRPRNHLFLKVSYLLGARVSEMTALTWEDFHPDKDHVVVTLFGKGEKTRHVLLNKKVWDELQILRLDALPQSPVFMSSHKKPLSRMQAYRIVSDAAKSAGVNTNVSPHWFRHAHASHALENGAPMPLIQKDLGHYSLEITGRYLHVKPTDGSGLYLRV